MGTSVWLSGMTTHELNHLRTVLAGRTGLSDGKHRTAQETDAIRSNLQIGKAVQAQV